MKYTRLGKSGIVVSRFALGAMTFGQGTLVGELKTRIDQTTADSMVGMALDAGINLFDTADMYTSGESETMLGKSLKGRRQDVIISTKCGFRSGGALISTGLSYRYMLHAVQASLRRLDTDYIDLFLLHIPDPVTPLEETVRALDDIVRKGWVRYVGYCNYPAWMAQKMLDLQELNNLSGFICAQMYYSLLGRDIEYETIPFLEHNGLGLMVWSPLASGFLSGKYTRENPVPPESRREKFDFPPVDAKKGFTIVDRLKKIGKKYNATPGQVAYGWLLDKPNVSTVLIGANTIAQLEENLKAADLVLGDKDVKALDDLTSPRVPYPSWMQGMGWDMRVREALRKD